MQKRIGVIYTGGTFGMVASAEGLAPASDLPDRVDALLERAAQSAPSVAWLDHGWQPLASCDLKPAFWYDLAACIAGAEYCDGFVVIHGTDTLAYTACALSFLLRGLGRPVIVTGARAPLGAADSDAESNFFDALRGAQQCPPDAVGVAFGGHLLRGNRTTKRAGTPQHPFTSPACAPLTNTGAPSGQHGISEPGRHRTVPTAAWSPVRVGVAAVFPGMQGDTIEALARAHPDGLVLAAYPAGVGPGADTGVTDAIAQAVAQGTFIGAVADSAHGRIRMGRYASSTPLERAGVVAGADMTREAALTKLHVALCGGFPGQSLDQAFTGNQCGELTPTDDPASA